MAISKSDSKSSKSEAKAEQKEARAECSDCKKVFNVSDLRMHERYQYPKKKEVVHLCRACQNGKKSVK